MSLAVTNNYYTNPAGSAQGTTDYYKSGAKFIPDIFSGKLLVKFYKSTCLSEITNSDWEGEVRDVGDKVIIRTVPNITIRDYSKGGTLTTEVPSSDPIELLVDKGKYWATVVDDVDKVQADIALMEKFTNDASQQMKIAIEAQVFAAVPASAHASNSGNTAGVVSGNIVLGTSGTPLSVTKVNAIDTIIDYGLCLDEQNVPEEGRWLIIPAGMAARIKKSDLKDASITGDGQSIVRNGRLGMIDRFTIYSSNNLSVTGGKYSVMAGTRDAISWASQLVKTETLRAQSTFGDILRGLNVYGFKVTKPEALVHSVITLG